MVSIYNQLLEEVENHPAAVGLSAIQIGIPKRVFIVKHFDGKGGFVWDCYANPHIVTHTDTIKSDVEGCLSFPQIQVRIPRFLQITVETEFGIIEPAYEQYVLYGLDSIVFQHELDHLNGVLFFDKGTVVSAPLERNDPCFCGSAKKFKKCCGRGM